MNSENRRAYRKLARNECFRRYGEVCACCGEAEKAFLTLDHVDKDGAEHRKRIGVGGHLCEYLRKTGFPTGFQTLCHNCNWARSALGECPHKDSARCWSASFPVTPPSTRVRLSAQQEAEIRARYVPRVVSLRLLGAEYGVSYATILRVVRNSQNA